MNAVWIVDDDRSIRWVLEKALAREEIPYKSFGSAPEVLAALDGRPPPRVLVSDIRMPGESGLSLLSKVKARFPHMPVIIMTAYSDLDSAVAAFQGGAFEYLPKPFDVDQAVELVRRAIEESAHQGGAVEELSSVPEILGQAPAMQEVFRAIGRLSQSHATVLINGESGSGKELVARALHRHSPRGTRPSSPSTPRRSPRPARIRTVRPRARAFTGAQTMRRGRFEQAEGGTLFLDEIGDMPAELQTRLLRVLSDNNFYRVGGHQPIKANVRVIAATHQNMEERVRQGLFREDLFHRLNVIRLRLPPLRERREDIPPWPSTSSPCRPRSWASRPSACRRRPSSTCRAWISRQRAAAREPLPLAHRDGAGADRRGGRSAARAEDHPVRDQPANWGEALMAEVDRVLAQSPGEVFDLLNRDFERILIRRALNATGGRRIEAAQLLGIGRNTITRKIQELGLEEPDHA
jgi:two-component system nitrogen regulation response regulator GlnG